MPIFGRSLLGAGYVVLNIIRAMNIIAFLSVIAASSVMLVKTFIVSKFFFFDACEHVIRIVMAGMSPLLRLVDKTKIFQVSSSLPSSLSSRPTSPAIGRFLAIVLGSSCSDSP